MKKKKIIEFKIGTNVWRAMSNSGPVEFTFDFVTAELPKTCPRSLPVRKLTLAAIELSSTGHLSQKQDQKNVYQRFMNVRGAGVENSRERDG